MSYIVDASLRSYSVQVVQAALREEYRSRSNGGKGGDGGQMVAEKMAIFYNLLRNVIRKKLTKFAASQLEDLTMNSSTFLGEGHGSIEICEPPTEAQERIIKSLVKVVFHQLQTCGQSDKFADVDEGHANLFLSLFVKSIHCEYFEETSLLNSDPELDVQDCIRRIFDGTGAENTRLSETQKKTTFHHAASFTVHLYCSLGHVSHGSGLLEEFDKIDLETDLCPGEEQSEGPTLASLSYNSESLSELPISKQTLNLTRIALLPSDNLEGLWECLHFDDGIKRRLYSYATVALKVASLSSQKPAEAAQSSFGNNKLILVHGPPGTGKTTVCKSLCQKLSIRREFSREIDPLDATHKGMIVELSCSQIFSRWFGESSKNLATIFGDVENLLIANQQTGSFVCLLIDEVEAIAFSRSDLLQKNESTDGVRVVSTLLTQLDRLKKYNNLIILATSNLLESLDPAFIDRTDGVFYVGNPSRNGIAKILSSGMKDMITNGVITSMGDLSNVLNSLKYKKIMDLIAEKCLLAGTSGRTLSKLPLISLSEHFRTVPVSLDRFLIALAISIRQLSEQA
ncbi:hypothetical protein HG536_0H02890 [Torulaspora globosa]|uniref:AAA+ ATPase domain-containing protein n=1 Tax=Torulaspora globosa TaxID=48254 RepID=A0A7G3ZN28_9SACH|nr:uncharacterized protein HG536_0H02890 [Torulaspora globosa]QLL34914.1 hypothetical protein HG536_0H02890 [Torulaspora globosa]